MRVVVFGYMTWGHRTLAAVLAAGHDVPLVVTHPQGDDPYERIQPDSVAALAAAHGVPVLERARADDAVRAAVAAARADAAVVANWRTWIPPAVYTLPRLGTLNVHDALLPAYAGFAPLNWALINGEPEVGVTAHLMNAEFDAGDVVLARATAVTDDDTIVELLDRTTAMFGPLAVDGLALLEQEPAQWPPQDRKQASYFHKRGEEENRVDWTWPARDLANLVRAQLDPYPNAFCYAGGERLRLLRASVTATAFGGTPGRIALRHGDGIVVVTGPDARRGRNPGLVVERVRTDDGREVAAGAYFPRLGGYLTSHPAL